MPLAKVIPIMNGLINVLLGDSPNQFVQVGHMSNRDVNRLVTTLLFACKLVLPHFMLKNMIVFFHSWFFQL